MKNVRTVAAAFLICGLVLAAAPASGCLPPVFNVRDYGAKGDKQAGDQKAIQAAIDACAKAGGGTVRLPPGDYLSGTLRLRSNVTLRLDKGATLWASTDPADYEGKRSGHLLLADDAEHVGLGGEGTINGQATADYGARWGAPEAPAFRTGILLFTGCRNVSIRGVTILYSDAWTLHLKRCEDVTIEGVTIRNNLKRLNSDGIDPNSCKRVRITNCDIAAGDDCIVLKATEPYPCEDVVVAGCTLETTCTALKLGTESYGDFRDVLFKDCTIRRAPIGIGFYMKDGGTMERITFTNIKMEASGVEHHTVVPIFMDIERRNADSKIGRIRDVTLQDIDITSGSGILIQGMPESPIENLTLRRIAMRADRADDCAKRSKPVGGRRTTRDDRDTRFARLPTYAALAHLKNVTVDGLTVRIAADAMKGFPRSALAGRAIEGGVIGGVGRDPPEAAVWPQVLDLQDCRNVR
ncbi:MAG: glycoside hydrolase family 28 protein, partial [Planctomycetes bacterium]|nr:glycoside hydrolase family 28 protein [Planctomycetota bacterium]